MKGIPITGPIRDESPCYDCKKPIRHYGCHDTCKRNAEWEAKVERVNQNRRDYAKNRDIGWRKK